MAGVFSAWLTAIALVAWRRGLGQQPPQWPPPSAFLNATVYMSIISFVARANGTVGGLLAWGTVLALFLAKGQAGQPSPIEDFSTMVTTLLGQQSATTSLRSASGQQTPLTFRTGAGTFPGQQPFSGVGG